MKKILFVVVVLGLALQLNAQNVALSKVDNLYRLYAYSEAVDGYQKLLKRTPDNEYLIQQIAYCYEKMGLYKEALSYYEKHVNGKRARKEDNYQYAQLLLIDSQFEKATEEFKKYQKLNPTDKRPVAQIARIERFGQLNLLQLVDTIFCESFNTRFADLSPAFFKDKIAYVSARDSSGGNTYSWNNQPFLDIYQLGTDLNGVAEIQKMDGVNSKYHEGPMAFTNDGNTVWFTRNNPKFSGTNKELTSNLKIFITEWDGKKWKGEHEFQYNSNTYSVGHPAFSRDGNTMYFASNMEGSLGATDLFKVQKVERENNKGKLETVWSEPVNMGKQFNTEGKEMFPFVDSRGVIFFASDGLIGFGGLDIFAAFPVADSFNVMNLGQPINSTYDDFSFIVNDGSSKGYLTSNRPGGVGSDDIYSFFVGKQKLIVNVKSLKTKLPIANSTVKYTVNGKTSTLGKTDDKGNINIDVEYDKNYTFDCSNPDFISNSDSLLAFEIFKLPEHTKTVYLDNIEQTLLDITVLNEENNEPVSDAKVLLTFENGKKQSSVTDTSGKIKQVLDAIGKIKLSAIKEKFLSSEKTINIDKLGEGNFSTTIKLAPIYEGKTFVLENLYYDLAKWNIRPDAALILDQLLKVLVENPAIKIELSSHTDCRSSTPYNQSLSQKRAQSAVDYLVSKGIVRSRMVAVGYGESKLLNKCADGVQCSDEEHQKNRRTEVKVLGL